MSRRAFVTEVQVTAHTYSTGGSSEQLYSGVLDGKLDLQFQDPIVSLSIAGGTISASGTNWATITGNGSNVVLTGVKYLHETRVYTKRSELVGANDAEKVLKVTDCTLISDANVGNVLQQVYDYYVKRDTFAVNVLPGAAKPGDRVQVDTDFDGVREGILVSLDWTGSNTLAANAEVILDQDNDN